jgi:hypothetical protein
VPQGVKTIIELLIVGAMVSGVIALFIGGFLAVYAGELVAGGAGLLAAAYFTGSWLASATRSETKTPEN